MGAVFSPVKRLLQAAQQDWSESENKLYSRPQAIICGTGNWHTWVLESGSLKWTVLGSCMSNGDA